MTKRKKEGRGGWREGGRESIPQSHFPFQAMKQILRSQSNEKQLLSLVDELTGSIALHGNYRERVKLWLLSLGF